MHTPQGINGNGPNANTTALLLCISQLNNDYFLGGFRHNDWSSIILICLSVDMKQPHAVLHVNGACAQLSLSLLPRLSLLTSPLPPSSQLQSHPLLLRRTFSEKAPTVFSVTPQNTNSAKRHQPQKANKCTYPFFFFFFCWNNYTPSLARLLCEIPRNQVNK